MNGWWLRAAGTGTQCVPSALVRRQCTAAPYQKRVGSLVALVLLAAAPLATAGDIDARKHYWQERLARELPVGSDLATVQKFFEQAHLEHRYDESSNTIYAFERNFSGWSVRWNVMMKCTFGPRQTLRACTTRAVGTGP